MVYMYFLVMSTFIYYIYLSFLLFNTEVKSTEGALDTLKSALQEQEDAMTEQDKLLSSKEEEYKSLAEGKLVNARGVILPDFL